MMRTLGLLLALVIALPSESVFAATAAECRAKVQYEYGKEQRRYRIMLYGRREAEDERINTVRYDSDGLAWLKEEDDKWINSSKDSSGLTWPDATMDAQDEHSDLIPTIGIFETKRVMTSELIPYLLQAIRAFDCRLDMLSERIRISEKQSAKDPVVIESIQPIGCMEWKGLETFTECHLNRGIDPDKTKDISETLPEDLFGQGDIRGNPEELANALMLREIELLKLAVEYDAGYRSMLQLAGNMNIFIKEMRWLMTGTLRNATALFGNLERIHCVMNACDGYPPPP